MVIAILVFLVGFGLGIVLTQRERRVQVAGAAVGLVVLLLPFYIHDHGGFNRYSLYYKPSGRPERVDYPDRCKKVNAPTSDHWKCPNYPWPISGQ